MAVTRVFYMEGAWLYIKITEWVYAGSIRSAHVRYDGAAEWRKRSNFTHSQLAHCHTLTQRNLRVGRVPVYLHRCSSCALQCPHCGLLHMQTLGE